MVINPSEEAQYTPSTDSLLKSGMTILQQKRCKKIMEFEPRFRHDLLSAAQQTPPAPARDKWSDFIWRKVLQLHVCPCAWERPDAESSRGGFQLGVS